MKGAAEPFAIASMRPSDVRPCGGRVGWVACIPEVTPWEDQEKRFGGLHLHYSRQGWSCRLTNSPLSCGTHVQVQGELVPQWTRNAACRLSNKSMLGDCWTLHLPFAKGALAWSPSGGLNLSCRRTSSPSLQASRRRRHCSRAAVVSGTQNRWILRRGLAVRQLRRNQGPRKK